MTTPTTREQWFNAFAEKAAPHFKKAGAPLPKKVRCLTGFSSKGARSNVIGQCWSKEASADGVFEIFVHPSLEAPSRIAGVLVHELIHAAVGIPAGHGPAFKKIATALGLEGKMTATTEGEKFREWAGPILKALGKFPGAPLNASKGTSTSAPKKQDTRMLKLTCSECGWSCRTSRQHIEAKPEGLCCPDYACGGKLEG